MRPLKIGMISFAHGHAFGYFESLMKMQDVQVTGIMDEDGARVEEIVRRYHVPYFADPSDLLATDIDAVVICSENAHHARLTKEAARAGKHVLCEKPLGVTLEEMQEMIEVCAKNNVKLMTAFPCRYLPAVIEAKNMIDRGEVGDIIAIKGTNRGTMPGGWFIDRSLSGGGAVFDHTVHVTDLMNWFLGSKVVEVYAETATLFHDIDIDDAGTLHMKYENGVVAMLDPSWSRPKSFPTWGDVTMEIVGTKGVLSIDAFAQNNEIYRDDSAKAHWDYWGDDMDALMISDFVKAIREEGTIPITGEDGFWSAIVAIAAYESARQESPVLLSNLRGFCQP